MSRSEAEDRAAGIATADTRHHMLRRTPWHDYHLAGTYMLTLVVSGRCPLLGRLVVTTAAEKPGGYPSAATVPGGSSSAAATVPGGFPPGSSTVVRPPLPADAAIKLTPLGRAIRDEEIRKVSAFYPMVEVWRLCIMPDHLHLIVRVREALPPGKHLGHVVSGFKTGCTKAWWRLQEEGLMPGGKPPGTVAAHGKPPGTVAATYPPSAATRPSLFEQGYNDKILMNDGQLERWKRYLDQNPWRLAVKRLCPDLFTVLTDMMVAGRRCQLVGNRFLLDIPQKTAVIVHRGYSQSEFADLRSRWMACGEAGGVLVSAAVAPREKEVMRQAADLGYRLILLRENGFPALYKPSGEAFTACASGQLLQLSPWPFHMQRHIISREQCLQLNRLAEQIAAD